jgi:hypothetical protein
MTSSIPFQNIIPQIIPTDTIDVYDVVFNVQMPENVPTPPPIGGTPGTPVTAVNDEDFYCNNKLSITLSYSFQTKQDNTYFSSTTGQGQQTACVLTPPIEMSKAAAEYSITETAATAGTPTQSSLDLVKASGVYFTTYDTLNEKIKENFAKVFDKLHTGFGTIAKIDQNTKDSSQKAQECRNVTVAVDTNASVDDIKKAQTSATDASQAASTAIKESKTEIAKLTSLDDYFSQVVFNPDNASTPPATNVFVKDKITELGALIDDAIAAAKKADTDVTAYFDALIKKKNADQKVEDSGKKLQDAKKAKQQAEQKLKFAQRAQRAALSAPPPPSATSALSPSDAAQKELEAAQAAEAAAQKEYNQAQQAASATNANIGNLQNAAKDSTNTSATAIQLAHEAVNSISKQFLPFNINIFMKNIDADKNKQGTYLKSALKEQLEPKKTDDSTFRDYKSSYNTESKVSNFLMNNGIVTETVTKDKSSTGNIKYNEMQFDFNLYDYQLNDDGSGVTKKKDLTHNPDQQSLLLLLKKNQYFSIVFKNITIPFNVADIPKDKVTVTLKIINTKPMGTITPSSVLGINSQDAFNIFYKLFFPKDTLIILRNLIQTPITVKDFFFSEEEMLLAKDSSGKYKDKFVAIQKMSRMFLVYYIKFLGDSFTVQYQEMIRDIIAAKTGTSALIDKPLTTSTEKNNLSGKVSTANGDITEFSYKFSFQDIENFRKQFSQALSRELRLTGIAKINDDLLLKILTQMSNKRNTILDPVSDESKKSIYKPNSNNSDTIENITSIPKGETGVGIVAQGGEYSSEQSGGAIPLVNTSPVESWNYIVPMCMADAGTSLNNMVVTIDKKILREASASVNIQVGDTIRFVNKDGNITYALVCGFKPGKKNKSKEIFTQGKIKKVDDNSRDYEMDMIDFRNTNIDIIKAIQSQKLSITPLQYLNITNLRGIRYLPFTYDDPTYSFAEVDKRADTIRSNNLNMKAGLKGKFTFRCDISSIPLLPNGYKYSWGSKALESIKNFGRKYMPGSTQADIGKDMDIPEYSLSSYMTLEKVMTPLNFDPVISYLKTQKDSAINDPDSMIKGLVKIMEDNGLNLSNSCKDKTGKLKTADLEKRKNEFITMANTIRTRFQSECMTNGVVDPDKAINFIQGLYNETVEPGILVNEQGITMQTVPMIIYALSLIPSDLNLNMKLLLLALSQQDIKSFKDRRTDINGRIIKQRSDDTLDDGVLEGGATLDEAKQIIANSINILDSQDILPPGSTDTYRRALRTAAIGFNPNTAKQQLEHDNKRVKENAAAYVGAQQETRKAGAAQMQAMTDSMALVASGNQKQSIMDRAKSAASKVGSFFSKKSTAVVPSADGMPMFSLEDSCGNNTHISCNGEDIIISVSLKLKDLISSCVDPDDIRHMNRELGASPLLTGADAAVEVGGRSEQPSPYSAFALAKHDMEPLPRIESVNRYVEEERKNNPPLRARHAEAPAPQSPVQPPVPTSNLVSSSASDFSASLKPGGSELGSAAPDGSPAKPAGGPDNPDGSHVITEELSAAQANASGSTPAVKPGASSVKSANVAGDAAQANASVSAPTIGSGAQDNDASKVKAGAAPPSSDAAATEVEMQRKQQEEADKAKPAASADASADASATTLQNQDGLATPAAAASSNAPPPPPGDAPPPPPPPPQRRQQNTSDTSAVSLQEKAAQKARKMEAAAEARRKQKEAATSDSESDTSPPPYPSVLLSENESDSGSGTQVARAQNPVSERTSDDIAKAKAKSEEELLKEKKIQQLSDIIKKTKSEIEEAKKLVTSREQALTSDTYKNAKKVTLDFMSRDLTTAKSELRSKEQKLPELEKELQKLTGQKGGSRKKKHNSSNKSKKNNKSSKRKTKKVTSSKSKKVKFIK